MVLLHSNINTADKEAVELVLAQLDKLENVQRAMPKARAKLYALGILPLPTTLVQPNSHSYRFCCQIFATNNIFPTIEPRSK